jgi:hypothetical protein
MKILKFSDETVEQLLELAQEKNIRLEGNILKLIDSEENQEFKKYIKHSIDLDNEKRSKRLVITKKIQQQNIELLDWKNENEKTKEKLSAALVKAETAKKNAEADLDILQKKYQNELIERIVKAALIVIIGVAISVTILYTFALIYGRETQLIGNTWSNVLGILLTNAFSIVGTITGVKYADSARENSKSKHKD